MGQLVPRMYCSEYFFLSLSLLFFSREDFHCEKLLTLKQCLHCFNVPQNTALQSGDLSIVIGSTAFNPLVVVKYILHVRISLKVKFEF